MGCSNIIPFLINFFFSCTSTVSVTRFTFDFSHACFAEQVISTTNFPQFALLQKLRNARRLHLLLLDLVFFEL